MKYDKRILHVHRQAKVPSGKPSGFPMPTWYDKGDENLRAMNAANREAEKARAERFRPPANVPLIPDKRSWWPF
jgi:hypothetical protein